MAADTDESARPGTIAEWCGHHLHSRPVASFLIDSRGAPGWGFDLADGRAVAITAHPASPRTDAAVAARRAAAEVGIGSPLLLAGPAPFGDDGLLLLAETWSPGGTAWPQADPPGSYGRLLARLVTACAGLDPALLTPAPDHLRYDHRAADRIWAPADDAADPESVLALLPPSLAGLASSAQERLRACSLPPVVGHGGLHCGSVRWDEGPGGVPSAFVFGWDDLAARPEAVFAGCLAATFNALPGQLRIAPVVEGRLVLASYQALAGRDFTAEEVQVAWTAGIWVACYLAAREHLAGGAGQVTHQLLADASLRMHLAGS